MRTLVFIAWGLLFMAGSVSVGSAQSYANPESVEYHLRGHRHLVGNTSGGILARASDGTLSVFTSDPAAPYGIELLAGTLYALDSGFLRGYDIDSAQRVTNHAIANAQFLNGITSDGAHTLYLSDFSGRKIIPVDVGNPASPITGTAVATGSATPNGLVYDRSAQRVLVATWGGSAKILSFDPATGALAPLINTSLSNLDGIALDCRGGLIVSAWGGCGAAGGCLARFTPPFTLTSTPTILATGLASPADIDYSRFSGDIAVPQSGNDTVTLHATGCEAALFMDDFER